VDAANVASRLEAVESVLTDPPQVHAYASAGVWHTERSAYEFMARHCPPGTRTLETGLGISTLLFAIWRTEHTCVVPDGGEVERLVAHADSREIDMSTVRFELGRSDEVLPVLHGPPLDLVLVDGSHGFPLPIIDWYYASARLRPGGHVILDDVQLTQVSLGLLRFLARDPRWSRVATTWKWAAYRRETDHSLSEEWIHQGFLDRKFELKRSTGVGRAFLRRIAGRS
jgi:hypothetical protein